LSGAGRGHVRETGGGQGQGTEGSHAARTGGGQAREKMDGGRAREMTQGATKLAVSWTTELCHTKTNKNIFILWSIFYVYIFF